MAVSNTEMSDGDLFTQLGMLIIQGRKWDSFRRCRSRGLHCPSVRNSSPPHHQCSAGNIECQTALSFCNTIRTIWQNSNAMVIDVILLPECGHHSPTLLLEKWSLQSENGNSTMPRLSLMQAIDSTIHFSQLSSWWASTNGCQPQNVQYRVSEDDFSPSSPEFMEPPINHQFPSSQGIQVKVQYLPRQTKIPELVCSHCSSGMHNNMDTTPAGSPNRGRSFINRGRRRGSRHSSASSDSLSPSVTRLEISPYGSPLLPSHLRRALSSSSSSRGSSRTGSPCVSRSPSEHNVVLTFETSRQMDEQTDGLQEEMTENITSRNDSGFVDHACGDSVMIDQDEELANQLDSLSDSDLSDDYVIDGPVGSPGLVRSCLASPDDTRVQILQSTFAGWHCRRPTFDRLMSDSGPNRIRHSSLDSAVSNLERLDLRTQRRLSRTSSDGQDFAKLASQENRAKDSNKDFFIRDIKKRHKGYSLDLSDDKDSEHCTPDNSFYASFCTHSETLWKKTSGASSPPIFDPLTSLQDFVLPSDSTERDAQRDIEFTSTFDNPSSMITQPLTQSTPCITSNAPTEEVQDSNCTLCALDTCQHKSSEDNNPPNISNFRFCQVKTTHHQSIDLTPITKGPWDISYPSPLTNPLLYPDNHALYGTKYPSVEEGLNRSLLHYPTLSKSTPCIPRTIGADDESIDKCAKQEKEESFTAQKNLKANELDQSASILLRSPPSKLRILPNHCVDKSFIHNPPRDAVHKATSNGQCKPARRLQFNQAPEKPTCSSPAPIRRNNSIRFEFDEDMPKLNQRSSRSMCKGKCMKKNGAIVHVRTTPTRRLLGSFEESIMHECLEVLGTVEGFTAQLGASGSFCPAKVKLPVPVQFFHVSDDNAPSPYMGTMSLKGRECGKRGYHIPRKGTIQLTLFNPNNSVVKVFIILYDVSDMPAGHQTFLRHRIFSKALSESPTTDCNANIVKSPPNQMTKQQVDKNKCLRYCLNLWLESSKTNKVYIHGDVKILFSLASNEWDSGNTFELQAETEFPKNPKYSPKR